MLMADLGEVRLHYDLSGDDNGAAVVFVNSLGTDFRLWDKVVARLSPGLRVLRYDMRGHGLSDAPPAPYAMGALVRDLEQLMQHLGLRDAVVVGLSIGGLVAQGLAVKRLDLVRGLVLSNTAAKIGTREIWQQRIATVRAEGIEGLANATMDRWFGAAFRATPECAAWRAMLTRTPVEGYAGCAAALAGADFYVTTAGLRLPALGIAGSVDGATPPDMVRETLDLIPGARFALIQDAGHLPCVDQPDRYAGILNRFLGEIGHAPRHANNV
jgi:3-oxoadipate enol-lactonase